MLFLSAYWTIHRPLLHPLGAEKCRGRDESLNFQSRRFGLRGNRSGYRAGPGPTTSNSRRIRGPRGYQGAADSRAASGLEIVPPPATGFASKAHVVRAPFQVAREVGGPAGRARGARRPGGPPGRSAARFLSRGRPVLTHTLPPPAPSIMALFPGANGSVDLTGPRPAARRAARAALAAPWGTQKPVL